MPKRRRTGSHAKMFKSPKNCYLSAIDPTLEITSQDYALHVIVIDESSSERVMDDGIGRTPALCLEGQSVQGKPFYYMITLDEDHDYKPSIRKINETVKFTNENELGTNPLYIKSFKISIDVAFELIENIQADINTFQIPDDDCNPTEQLLWQWARKKVLDFIQADIPESIHRFEAGAAMFVETNHSEASGQNEAQRNLSCPR